MLTKECPECGCDNYDSWADDEPVECRDCGEYWWIDPSKKPIDWEARAVKLQADNKFLVSERDEVAYQVCVMEAVVDAAKAVSNERDILSTYLGGSVSMDALMESIRVMQDAIKEME